jgi:hypothetical protein
VLKWVLKVHKNLHLAGVKVARGNNFEITENALHNMRERVKFTP